MLDYRLDVARAALPLLAALGLGCDASPLRILPPTPDGTKALIVVVERGPTVDAIGIDATTDDVFELPLDDYRPLELTALAYGRSLERMGLAEGSIRRATPTEVLGARLPPPSLITVTKLKEARGFDGWLTVDTLPSAAGNLRLAVPSADQCINDGGCFDVIPSDGEPLCDRVCPPIPEPAVPTQPEAVRRDAFPEAWWDGEALLGPWPIDAEACPAGWLRTPRQPSCQPLDACPQGFGRYASRTDVIFVDPSTATPGPGSVEAPQKSLDVSNGGRFVLAPGHYEFDAVDGPRVELLGVCPDEVSVSWSGPTPSLTRLEGLSVQSELQVQSELSAESVRFLDRVVVAENGRLRGERASFQGNVEVRAYGALELFDAMLEVDGSTTGLHITGQARLESVFARAESGLVLASGGTLEFEQLVLHSSNHALTIHGVASGTQLLVRPSAKGDGVRVAGEGRATLSGVVVQGSDEIGLGALGGELRVDDAIIRPAEASSNNVGTGLRTSQGGMLDAKRVSIREARGYGVHVTGLHSKAELEDVEIVDTQEGRLDEPPEIGIGLTCLDASATAVHRVLVDGTHYAGVTVRSRDASLEGEDLSIRRIHGRVGTGRDGMGMRIADKGRARLSRLSIDEATSVGILVEDALSRFDSEDLHITRTRANGDNCSGSNCNFGVAGGIRVENIARASLRGFVIENNVAYGVAIGSESQVKLSEGAIRGHERGIISSSDAQVLRDLAERVRAHDNLEAFVDL